MLESIPLSARVWGLRILIMAGIILLGVIAGSSAPALGLMLAWTPNLLFLVAFTHGALRLPRFLVPVKPIEPALYRRVGVGLVKRIVATDMWPLLHGVDPPEKLKPGQESLDHAELTMMGAEVCHGATFLLTFPVAMVYLAAGRTSEVCWILAFNMLLNGYPVMLQRANRWRLQQVRAKARHEKLKADRPSVQSSSVTQVGVLRSVP
jgi:hypothetical protein